MQRGSIDTEMESGESALMVLALRVGHQPSKEEHIAFFVNHARSGEPIDVARELKAGIDVNA